MKQKRNVSIGMFLILGILLSACATQVDVTGQLDQNQATGSLDINLGLNDGGGNNNANTNGSTQPANQTPVVSTQGLLILVGLGLVVVIGLLLGLMQSKGRK